MKIGIVGSREYTNSRKIKDFVSRAKEKFGDELEIVSGENPNGADRYAKKWALFFNVKYISFPPYHYTWNQHCPKPAYLYGKEYKAAYYFLRNQDIADYVDVLACFIPDYMESIKESRGTYDTYKKAKKLEKEVVIIS